jgi:hypothetical protein
MELFAWSWLWQYLPVFNSGSVESVERYRHRLFDIHTIGTITTWNDFAVTVMLEKG